MYICIIFAVFTSKGIYSTPLPTAAYYPVVSAFLDAPDIDTIYISIVKLAISRT